MSQRSCASTASSDGSSSFPLTSSTSPLRNIGSLEEGGGGRGGTTKRCNSSSPGDLSHCQIPSDPAEVHRRRHQCTLILSALVEQPDDVRDDKQVQGRGTGAGVSHSATTQSDQVSAALDHFSSMILLGDKVTHDTGRRLNIAIAVPATSSGDQISRDSLAKAIKERKPDVDTQELLASTYLVRLSEEDCAQYLQYRFMGKKQQFLRQKIFLPLDLSLHTCLFDFALEGTAQLSFQSLSGKAHLFFAQHELFLQKAFCLLKPGQILKKGGEELSSSLPNRLISLTGRVAAVSSCPALVVAYLDWVTDLPSRSFKCLNALHLGLILPDSESYITFYTSLCTSIPTDDLSSVTSSTPTGSSTHHQPPSFLEASPLMKWLRGALDFASVGASASIPRGEFPHRSDSTGFVLSDGLSSAQKKSLDDWMGTCSVCTEEGSIDLAKVKKCNHVVCEHCIQGLSPNQPTSSPASDEPYFPPEVGLFTTDQRLGYCSTCDWKGTQGEYYSSKHESKCPTVTTYSNGDKYIGGLKEGKRHGFGTCIYSSGHKYEGNWEEGLMHGQGIYAHTDGQKFDGDWKEGKMHGQGTYTYADGAKYEGNWKRDKMHGQGTYTYADGGKYQGNWKDGKKHGQGIYTHTDGQKFHGDWKRDKKHGQGTYIYASGGKYEGNWKDNKYHGFGTCLSSTGDKYEGNWKDGKMHGQGTYTYASGGKYEGNWKDNKKHGQGTYIYSNGDKKEGMWSEGSLLERVAATPDPNRVQHTETAAFEQQQHLHHLSNPALAQATTTLPTEQQQLDESSGTGRDVSVQQRPSETNNLVGLPQGTRYRVLGSSHYCPPQISSSPAELQQNDGQTGVADEDLEVLEDGTARARSLGRSLWHASLRARSTTSTPSPPSIEQQREPETQDPATDHSSSEQIFAVQTYLDDAIVSQNGNLHLISPFDRRGFEFPPETNQYLGRYYDNNFNLRVRGALPPPSSFSSTTTTTAGVGGEMDENLVTPTNGDRQGTVVFAQYIDDIVVSADSHDSLRAHLDRFSENVPLRASEFLENRAPSLSNQTQNTTTVAENTID